MKVNGLVSVIIPAHNVESSLSQCLNSVLSQRYKNFEILLINDGSTDQTDKIARSYCSDNIKYFKQPNRGQGSARNRGIDNAKGEYIAFLDADDYWLPDFAETTVRFLSENTDAIAVSCGFYTRFHNGKTKIGPPVLYRVGGPEEPFILENFYKFWADQDHVRTGTALIRYEVIQKAGKQRDDLRVSQDLEYWGYIATYGKWGFIPTPLWVGNSRSHARGFKWIKRYKKRRKLCPTVEEWQKRIIPRIISDQIPCFRKVRGRVASGFAQSKIIAGNSKEALRIVKKYGEDMPENRLTQILQKGARSGEIGWYITCFIIRMHEYFKAMRTVYL
jgi:glycosyltransferase involved in cell wall biosynthesis